MITRKLMSAAFAVASIATLSLGAGGEAQARGGHSGGGSGMRASFSGKFSGGNSMVQRSQGNRFHFRGGDRSLVRTSLQRLFQDRLGDSVQAHVEE